MARKPRPTIPAIIAADLPTIEAAAEFVERHLAFNYRLFSLESGFADHFWQNHRVVLIHASAHAFTQAADKREQAVWDHRFGVASAETPAIIKPSNTQVQKKRPGLKP